MSTDRTTPRPTPAPPPSKHQLTLMIWLAVFPTLTVLNLGLSSLLTKSRSFCGPSSSPRSRCRSSRTH